MTPQSVRMKIRPGPRRCWVPQVAGCDQPICRECSELEKARIAATWTLRYRAELGSGTLSPGKPE